VRRNVSSRNPILARIKNQQNPTATAENQSQVAPSDNFQTYTIAISIQCDANDLTNRWSQPLAVARRTQYPLQRRKRSADSN
jgi:hypothetical protein